MPPDPVDEVTESRRQVESCCQALVDAGAAHWYVNDAGDIELELRTGEAYLFGDLGVIRCR
ncbi:hypothetical protein E1956_24265 [Paraburkholderia pallida]|uniref:Uncharacterized protein n=2 Tax=Paraburkholderia pallida TaxID=2547399 RepID=A0A4P7D209_9BURK|nr:hypothetical protein E1956_24265 [Paraburkholderia pallida]